MKLPEVNLSLSLDEKAFSSINWSIFFICLALGFLFSLCQRLNLFQFVNLPSIRLINPLAASGGSEVFAKVRPKLEVNPNNFSIHKSNSLIPKSYAQTFTNSAPGYITIDYDTGDVITGVNISKKREIASLTKIMTAVVTLDLVSEDEFFNVTRRAASEVPTRIGLVPDQRLSVKELLEALLMTSANDAAEMLRDNIDQKYGDGIFVKAMNAKAAFIGLKNTHFDNPQGFDGYGNYSTPEDLAVLARYALTNYPLLFNIVRTDYTYLPQDQNHKQYDLYNWNGLLGVYPNVMGVKIGNTDQAGYTSIVLSERSGKKILVVLLGAPGVMERDLWASQLLDISFEESRGLPMANVTAEQLRSKYSQWRYWN